MYSSYKMEMEESIEATSNGARENPYTVLETSLLKELDRLARKTASGCIHRVPPRLRLVCEKAYTPQLVSLGPLHHGKQALKGMEEHKMRYLRYFLRRTNNLSLMHYIEKVKDREAELRSCYSETIELESDEFVKIILVDAIFIIEFLFRLWYPELEEESDCIFGSPGLENHVRLDLLLLENQLPFFILEDLFDPDIFPIPSNYSHRLRDVESISIIFLSHFFLDQTEVFIGKELTVPNLETISCSQVKHFVDLSIRFYVAPIPRDTRQPIPFTVPSLEKLRQAGVEIKVGNSTNSLFDIKFKDGILEIPKLEVTDITETILRNLVAFEQCNFGESYISDYIAMMDYLVDTHKDVGLLVKYGIVKIELGGGDDELATLINSLATQVGISFANFYYGSLCQDLNKYCSSTCHRRTANLRQNYFNTPWKTISFIAAAFLLLLTTIQTICSILSLF